MSTEQNKPIVRRVVSAMGRGEVTLHCRNSLPVAARLWASECGMSQSHDAANQGVAGVGPTA
jgi:hypothetical protein